MRPTSLSDTAISINPETREFFFKILQTEFGIKERELHLIFEVCKVTGEKVGDALVRLGHLTEAQRQRIRAMQWGLSYVDIDRESVVPPPPEVAPIETFLKYQIVPLNWDGHALTVAISDPLDLQAVDDLRMVSGVDVTAVIAPEQQIKQALSKLATLNREAEVPELDLAPMDDEDVIQDAIEMVSADFSVEGDGDGASAYQLSALAEEAPVIKLVNSLMVRAIKYGASDLHVQPEAGHVRARFRVDGQLRDGPKLPPSLMRPLVARLRVMANLDLTESRHPQDGRINLRLGERVFQLRISLVPSVTGISSVIRIAEQSAEDIDLTKIGLSQLDLPRYRSIVERSNGLVLVTGPTGSGKSTTLYATLSHLNSSERKILTIEDPVERQLQGITQIETRESVNFTFTEGLRSALRHDPDVIMVGEIRDVDTAAIAIQASLTGHMVLTTLHTNDAASAVTRLVNMGIEPFLVASSLGGAMAQRLVRVLCPKCRKGYQVAGEQLSAFGANRDQPLRLFSAVGCEDCTQTGYVGRAPIFELLLHSQEIEQLILSGAADSAIRQKSVEAGMHTLQQEAARKVSEGVTSVEEALRVVQSRWATEDSEG